MIDRHIRFPQAARIAVAIGLALLAALLSACGSDSDSASEASAPSSAAELTKVKLAMKTSVGSPSAPLVIADTQGYFREEGLEVEFVIPGSNSDSPKLLASGDAQVGIVDTMDIIGARSRGIPLVSLAAQLQYGDVRIISPTKLNITSPKDLEGHTVGVSGLPGQTNMFKSILRNHNVDISKVKIVETGFLGGQAMAAGKVDAVGDGVFWNHPFRYNVAKGYPINDLSTVRSLRLDDLGAPRFYVNNVAMEEGYLKKNPDVARKFLNAFVKGMEFSLNNPAAAVDIVVKNYPAVKQDFALAQFTSIVPISTSPETKEHGLGWQDPGVWSALEDYLYQEKVIPTEVKAEDAMTNEYLPTK